jgi:hypothetical protein
MAEQRIPRRHLVLGIGFVLLLLVAGVSYGLWRRYDTARQEAHQAVLDYIRQTEEYSAPAIWPVLRYTKPVSLVRISEHLQEISPPPEMEEAHANLVRGYAFVSEGQTLLFQSRGGDGELRAEAEFVLSWGLSRVQEHYRLVQVYLEEHP